MKEIFQESSDDYSKQEHCWHFWRRQPWWQNVIMCIVLLWVSGGYCTRMPCSRRLIVQTLVLSRSYLHRQVSPPETVVVKGGTTWARNGRWILLENARLPSNIQRSFTCRKSTTWDKRLYFPSEGRRAEDFFATEKSYGFGRVWTRELGYQRPPKPLILCNRSSWVRCLRWFLWYLEQVCVIRQWVNGVVLHPQEIQRSTFCGKWENIYTFNARVLFLLN